MLSLAGMHELIQTTINLKPGFERSISIILRGRSGSMEMVISAIIIDASRLSLFLSLTMVIQRHAFDSIGNG